MPSSGQHSITSLDPTSDPGAPFNASIAMLYSLDSAGVALPRPLLYGEGSLQLLTVDTSGTTTGRFEIDRFRSFRDTTLRLGLDGAFNAPCGSAVEVSLQQEPAACQAERRGHERLRGNGL